MERAAGVRHNRVRQPGPDQVGEMADDSGPAHAALFEPAVGCGPGHPDDAEPPKFGPARIQSRLAHELADDAGRMQAHDGGVVVEVPVLGNEPVELWPGFDTGQIGVDTRRQLGPRRPGGINGCRGLGYHFLGRRPTDGEEEIGLVGEVTVEHRFGDSRGPGDVVHPDARPMLGNHRDDRADQFGPPGFAMSPPPLTPTVARGDL